MTTGTDMGTERYFHARIRTNNEEIYELDFLEEVTIRQNIVEPYFQGGKIFVGGMIIDATDIKRLQIYATKKISVELINDHKDYRRMYKQSTPEPDYSDNWFITNFAADYTRYFIKSIPEWVMKTGKVDVSTKILKRIDPNLDVLESWLTGTGTKPEKDFERAITILFHLCGLRTVHVGGDYESWLRGTGTGTKPEKDFERAITILFHLCGLRTVHVGGDYESATQRSRTEKHAKTTISTDVIALTHSNDVYLIQCTKEWNQNTLTNIVDVQKELKDLLQGDNIDLHPVIVSRVLRSKILESIDEADKKNVKVVIMDELILLLNEIRKGNQPLKQLLKYLKEVKT